MNITYGYKNMHIPCSRGYGPVVPMCQIDILRKTIEHKNISFPLKYNIVEMHFIRGILHRSRNNGELYLKFPYIS
jgi:hypothetical protein